MTVTREVHREGQEVFAIDTEHLRTAMPCDNCMYRDLPCATTPCSAIGRTDNREVYFLPVTDLKGQLLFHSQEQP